MAFRSDALDGRGRAIASWLFWAAIAGQVLFALAVTRPWQTGDSPFYLSLANSIDHGFYGWPHGAGIQPDALRPPGYPILLWLLLHRLHANIALVVLLQMGLYVASIWLIDRRLARDGLNVVPFRLLALAYPFGAIYCGFVMTEAWATLALTSLALLVSEEKLTSTRLLLAGLLAGVASLFRADLLLLPLVIAMIVVARDWRSAARRVAIGRALLPLLAAVAVLTPYSLWNARHFGRLSPIPVASAVGNSLYLATWQGRVPLADLNALDRGVVTQRVADSGLAGEIERINRSIGAEPLTSPFNPASYPGAALQVRSSKAFGQAARKRIYANPLDYARHVGRNLWALWNTSAYPSGIPEIGRLALMLVSGLVFLIGVIGLLIAVRSRHRLSAAGLILLYPMIIHLPLHTEARYTAAVRPLLLMFASFAVLWLVKCYRQRQWQFGREAVG